MAWIRAQEPDARIGVLGYSLGGYGLHIRTEDIAKFGQLYLQRGKWNGQPLLSEKWVAEATSKHVDNSKAPSGKTSDWQQGYGFQFWRCQHNCFRGDGRDGQICLVIPEHDAVIAITAVGFFSAKPLHMLVRLLLTSYLRGHGLLEDAPADGATT